MRRRPSPTVPPWPKCPCCGGPAAPVGTPFFRWKFEVETRSEANLRERWGKVERSKKAKETTADEIAVALANGQVIPERGPWFVRITRISRGTLDDDNLGRALKSIRDVVAAVLGVNDASPAIRFDPRQRTEGEYLGVEIEIWGAP